MNAVNTLISTILIVSCSFATFAKNSAKGLYKEGKLQEAAWFLNEQATAESFEKANEVLGRLEEILQKAEIRSVTKNSLGGATKPQLLQFSDKGVKGIFKPKSLHLSSHFNFEIAAYIIDRMFRFDFVPMTIVRTIDGQIGSIQYFVGGCHEAKEDESYRKSSLLNAFDYLVRNMDRNSGNVLINSELSGREVAIDHGLTFSFSKWARTCRFFSDDLGFKRDPVRSQVFDIRKDLEQFRVPMRVFQRLSRTTKHQLKHEVGKWLPDAEIDSLFARLQRLVHVQALIGVRR